jgi:hypothetical protein
MLPYIYIYIYIYIYRTIMCVTAVMFIFVNSIGKMLGFTKINIILHI